MDWTRSYYVFNLALIQNLKVYVLEKCDCVPFSFYVNMRMVLIETLSILRRKTQNVYLSPIACKENVSCSIMNS